MVSHADERAGTLHSALIDGLVRAGHIVAPAIEAAFRATPRHHFLPGVPTEQVYSDVAIPTHEANGVPISSSSQPAAMAIMLEQFDVRPGDRVLEIGAGTGYNAALLAHLTGPAGSVVAVDLDEEIVAEARAHLDAAGHARVHLVCGDGGEGYSPGAPYDRIELTVGAWDIAPAWWAQLAPGGRLLVPLWLRGSQLTVAFEPAVDAAGQDHLASVSISGCSFMGLLESENLCLLLRGDDGQGAQDLQIRCYGPDSDAVRALGERLRGHLSAWHAAGQPTFKTLSLRVYPIGVTSEPPAATLIAKRWHTLAIDWDHL